MTHIITSQCINCHRCDSICPTGAITQNDSQHQINPERCNDCVGYYAVPQCWAACPTNAGCIANLASLRSPAAQSTSPYWDTWFETYDRLVARLTTTAQPDYWHRWFDRYTQALTQQLHPPTSPGVTA